MTKRLVDVVVSLLALVALGPLMAVIAILVRWRLGSPVLFRHRRPGLREEPFEMLKFRSMSDARDGGGRLLPDEARLGRFGKWLRASSLDELPELWNVLRGDMSLVGPRPLMMEYLPRYTVTQRRRHSVRPGITGWAQVSGRNALSWGEKFERDVWYVDHRSLALDLKILALTAGSVLSRRGISAHGHSTMPHFTGCEGQRADEEDGQGSRSDAF